MIEMSVFSGFKTLFDTDKPKKVDNTENKVAVNFLLKTALNVVLPVYKIDLKDAGKKWIQVSGHSDSFICSNNKTILKLQPKDNHREVECYNYFKNNDPIINLVPTFFREVWLNQSLYIEIEDLLLSFTDPNIMDLKMGTRTFQICEDWNQVQRNDLYERMLKLDSSYPNEVELQNKAMTKLRYLQFRDELSSTSTLGFRIEAIKLHSESINQSFSNIKSKSEVTDAFSAYTKHNTTICKSFLTRLKEIKSILLTSEFFNTHELIGSSLLFIYDKTLNINIWMIDFARCQLASPPISHSKALSIDSHEDGYLHGLDNLIQIYDELSKV